MTKAKKILITGFIIFNILAMIRVHLPINSSFFQALYRPVDTYLSFFSLYQSWTMFSPEPSRTNAYLTAEVFFDDKSKETFVFPRSSEMSLFQKYVNGERFRVLSEAIRRDENSFLWRDAAKFALRKVGKTQFHKIPIKVELIRHWNTIPEMEKKFQKHKEHISEYQSHKFYTYEVL